MLWALKKGNNWKIINVVNEHNKKLESLAGLKIYNIVVPRWHWKLKAVEAETGLFSLFIAKKINSLIKNESIIFIYQIYLWRAVKKWVNKKVIFLDVAEDLPEILSEYDHVKKFPIKYIFSKKAWHQLQNEALLGSNEIFLSAGEALNYYRDNYFYKNKDYNVHRIRNLVAPPNLKISFNQANERMKRIKYNSRLRLLYFGDTSFRRGVQDVIEALNLLKESDGNVPFLFKIIGRSANNDKHLKELIYRYNLKEYVSHNGYVDLSDMRGHFEWADVAVSPLHRNIHHNNTLANKIFQYTHYELPIIMSDVLAQKNYAKEESSNGIPFGANDIQNLASILKYINTNRGDLMRLQKNASYSKSEQKLELEVDLLKKAIDVYQ